MIDKIKLLQLTLPELKNLKSGNTLIDRFEYQFNIKNILPDIVIQATLKRVKDKEDWFWCAPRLFYHDSLNIIVGSGIYIRPLNERKVELGYSVVKSYEGKGFATAGVACLVKEVLICQKIELIIAQTSVDNIASERVLEKNGFLRNGQYEDEADGLLNLWKYEPHKNRIK
jgi:RimJ/RimL family protein N-acetyltransferase